MDTDSEWDTPTEIVSPSSSRNHVPNMKPLESPSRGKDKRRRLKRPDAGGEPSTQFRSNLPPSGSQNDAKKSGDMFTATASPRQAITVPSTDIIPRSDLQLTNHSVAGGGMAAVGTKACTDSPARSALSERKGRKYKPDYSEEMGPPDHDAAEDSPSPADRVTHRAPGRSHRGHVARGDTSPTHVDVSQVAESSTDDADPVKKPSSNRAGSWGRDILQKLSFHTLQERSVPDAQRSPLLDLSPEQVAPSGVVIKLPYEMHLINNNTSTTQVAYRLEESHSHYLQVSHSPTDATMARLADSVELYAGRASREIFASLRIFTSLFGLFLIEFLLFVSRDIFCAIVLRAVAVIADFAVKPILAMTVNVVVVPLATAVGSVMAAVVAAVNPAITLLADVCSQVALVVGAFRFVEVRTVRREDSGTAPCRGRQLEQHV